MQQGRVGTDPQAGTAEETAGREQHRRPEPNVRKLDTMLPDEAKPETPEEKPTELEGLEGFDRPSLDAIARELSRSFGGARGMALWLREEAFHKKSSPASRSRIIQFIIGVFKETSKIHGDRDKIRTMSREQIEHRLLQLIKSHGYTVPIPGIDLAASAQRAHDQEQAEALGRAQAAGAT